MEIRPLQPSEYTAAAVVLADAFLDDPGWVAVGPDRRERRYRLVRRFHRDALDVIHQYGRPIYGAFDGDALAGVAATFAAGLYPPPEIRTTLKFLPAFLRAGPGPLARGVSLLEDPGRGSSARGARLSVVPRRRPGAPARWGRPCPPRARVCRGRGGRIPRHRQPGERSLLREQRLRRDRQRGRAARRHDVVHEASLRRCASGSPSSFFSVLFSIWRMRSRVTPNARPTSSSVRAFCPRSP